MTTEAGAPTMNDGVGRNGRRRSPRRPDSFARTALIAFLILLLTIAVVAAVLLLAAW